MIFEVFKNTTVSEQEIFVFYSWIYSKTSLHKCKLHPIGLSANKYTHLNKYKVTIILLLCDILNPKLLNVNENKHMKKSGMVNYKQCLITAWLWKTTPIPSVYANPHLLLVLDYWAIPQYRDSINIQKV